MLEGAVARRRPGPVLSAEQRSSLHAAAPLSDHDRVVQRAMRLEIDTGRRDIPVGRLAAAVAHVERDLVAHHLTLHQVEHGGVHHLAHHGAGFFKTVIA